jgi:ABC-type multidrug transport system fused ATPase/permease subunit
MFSFRVTNWVLSLAVLSLAAAGVLGGPVDNSPPEEIKEYNKEGRTIIQNFLLFLGDYLGRIFRAVQSAFSTMTGVISNSIAPQATTHDLDYNSSMDFEGVDPEDNEIESNLSKSKTYLI